jgi:hypothetical protein
VRADFTSAYAKYRFGRSREIPQPALSRQINKRWAAFAIWATAPAHSVYAGAHVPECYILSRLSRSPLFKCLIAPSNTSHFAVIFAADRPWALTSVRFWADCLPMKQTIPDKRLPNDLLLALPHRSSRRHLAGNRVSGEKGS